MTRRIGAALAALVVAASAGAGAAAFAATRQPGPALPEISAFSHGEMVRVGPYVYCDVLNLDDCATAGDLGTLRADERYPVQLSVPSSIGRAPWRLLKSYADARDTTTTVFKPGSRLAVTVPTVDPQRGRLLGLVVQLMTLVQDQDGEVFDLPHAEWSVRLDWG